MGSSVHPWPGHATLTMLVPSSQVEPDTNLPAAAERNSCPPLVLHLVLPSTPCCGARPTKTVIMGFRRTLEAVIGNRKERLQVLLSFYTPEHSQVVFH